MMEAPYPIRPPQWPPLPTHVHWSGPNAMFSAAECDSIIAAGLGQKLGMATIGNGDNAGGIVDLDYRCVQSCSLWRKLGDNDLTWVYDRVANKIQWANADYYRFELTGLGEAIQFLRYEVAATPIPGHYLWHQDFGGGISSNRKISVVVQLSDPADYEGCRLELMNERVWQPQYIGKGEAIAFPSWTPHQVTMITRGTRYALAIWIHGPQFR